MEVTKFDREYNVLEAEVLVHSASKDEVYQALLKHKGKKLAIEYVGKLPEEITVLV